MHEEELKLREEAIREREEIERQLRKLKSKEVRASQVNLSHIPVKFLLFFLFLLFLPFLPSSVHLGIIEFQICF